MITLPYISPGAIAFYSTEAKIEGTAYLTYSELPSFRGENVNGKLNKAMMLRTRLQTTDSAVVERSKRLEYI